MRSGSLFDVVGIGSTDVLGNSTPDNFLFARQSCRTLRQEHIRESADKHARWTCKSGLLRSAVQRDRARNGDD